LMPSERARRFPGWRFASELARGSAKTDSEGQFRMEVVDAEELTESGWALVVHADGCTDFVVDPIRPPFHELDLRLDPEAVLSIAASDRSRPAYPDLEFFLEYSASADRGTPWLDLGEVSATSGFVRWRGVEPGSYRLSCRDRKTGAIFESSMTTLVAGDRELLSCWPDLAVYRGSATFGGAIVQRGWVLATCDPLNEGPRAIPVVDGGFQLVVPRQAKKLHAAVIPSDSETPPALDWTHGEGVPVAEADLVQGGAVHVDYIAFQLEIEIDEGTFDRGGVLELTSPEFYWDGTRYTTRQVKRAVDRRVMTRKWVIPGVYDVQLESSQGWRRRQRILVADGDVKLRLSR